MTKNIKIGIVGGGFSRSFPFNEHPNCSVVAVAEQRNDRLNLLEQQYPSAVPFHSLEELLAQKDVDAVAIFTPAPLHGPQAISALNAGKHVFCAVPAAFTLEECDALVDTVRHTGLTYMMAETSNYRRETMLARDWYREDRFGEIFYTEAEYWHDSLKDDMGSGDGVTWRYGFPPMHYPTHCTGFLTGITGERMSRVKCIGWGNDSPIVAENAYKNPFWNEMAFFETDRGHAARMIVGFQVGYPLVERATWFGDRMSFIMESPTGQPSTSCTGSANTPVSVPNFYDRLPEALRHDSDQGGSHPHLIHEFVSALIEGRAPAIDVYEAVAYTAPGIVAHQSALRGGESMAVPDFGSAAP